jgi:HK97 family phage major capsid protein
MTTTIERTNTLARARAIVERAKSEDRDLTAAESEAVESAIARVKQLDSGHTKSPSLFDRVMGLATSEDFTEDGTRRGFFTPEAKAGVVHAVKTRTAYRTDVDTKALTSNTLLPPSGTYVEGGLHPNSQFPISSLFRNLPADGPVQRYYRTTSGTAAVVAEGDLKPDAGIAVAAVDLPVAKLACTATFSTEMSEDSGYLVNYLSEELTAAVLAAENAAILTAFTGTSGVLTATGTTATVVDILADEIAAMEAISGITPAAVIAHPTVVAVVRKAKSSGSGDYTIDPLNSGPTTIHGVRVIPTPATPAGTAWLADASGVIVYRRGSLSVEVGTTGDNYQRNLQTAIAEERMATAVTKPSSLVKITLT